MKKIINITNSKKRLESKVQKQSVIDYAKSKGMMVFKIMQANCYGIGDTCIIFKGITCFLEVKTKNGKASATQLKRMSEINSHGGYAYIVYGDENAKEFIDNWEEVFGV